jgi:hypothetical protein
LIIILGDRLNLVEPSPTRSSYQFLSPDCSSCNASPLFYGHNKSRSLVLNSPAISNTLGSSYISLARKQDVNQGQYDIVCLHLK